MTAELVVPVVGQGYRAIRRYAHSIAWASIAKAW